VLSSMDDYPIHQIAAPVRHVGPSDRNFYDRYYFNLHGSTDQLFMVIGMGQYPNLATQDAFACICSKGKQRVLRASKKLGDRMDTTVGPFRVGATTARFIFDFSRTVSRQNDYSGLRIVFPDQLDHSQSVMVASHGEAQILDYDFVLGGA